MTKALFQSWEGWPRFRSSWKGTNQENYNCVGIQHLLLPEPLRYLNDRFVSVNIGVPPTDSIVRIASRELLPALAATFPMDVFQIRYVFVWNNWEAFLVDSLLLNTNTTLPPSTYIASFPKQFEAFYITFSLRTISLLSIMRPRWRNKRKHQKKVRREKRMKSRSNQPNPQIMA